MAFYLKDYFTFEEEIGDCLSKQKEYYSKHNPSSLHCLSYFWAVNLEVNGLPSAEVPPLRSSKVSSVGGRDALNIKNKIIKEWMLMSEWMWFGDDFLSYLLLIF